jgi:hypothetical protein
MADGLQNEGVLDRTVRIVIGLGLIGLIFIGPDWWWGAFGLIPLATGVAGFCPLYRLLHINTCRPGEA